MSEVGTEAGRALLALLAAIDQEEIGRDMITAIEDKARAEGRREAARPERIHEALVTVDQKWDWGRDGHAVARARITDFAADISTAILVGVGEPR